MARCQSCVENKLRALLRQERERVRELEAHLAKIRDAPDHDTARILALDEDVLPLERGKQG